ncbi:biotin-dependent carboxyltransferase family protein [Christiangramia salexigens]|uniref:Allophanate hydrolase n=1 Tax=Christiangramia salexigens TaxID=1913577 RepID=A0A1L3J239_9FLAO|nr:biotin-dependent carboxyltransferase family protein [Christiangramia salexigens]APG59194.1 allophanate hydrolase [Christiangramia salexigens]
MKAKIEVLHPGLFSSIQDNGRFGFQKFGVPLSGVMDKYAYKICNLLLGNDPYASVLEITLQGPQLKFEANTNICITGADLSPSINGRNIEINEVVSINAGEVLKFGMRINGFRSYLGVAGGFISEEIMKSRSWYEGITANSRLSKGMKLSYNSEDTRIADTYSSLKTREQYLESENLEVYPGPEFNKLSDKQRSELMETFFNIDDSSNRMAVQLKQDLDNDLDPIITGPVVPGTVQLTPSGKLIILMRDCQTTGGYPRVLQVSERGLNVLAQKLPGERIIFKIT